MRIAYFASLYPYASDTYVRNEVETLRRKGFDVRTFAVRRPPDSWLVDQKIQAEAHSTQYVLSGAIPRLVIAFLLTVLTKPIRLIQSFGLVWRSHSPGILNRFRQFAYVCQGALLSRLLLQSRIEHLHNHVAENSATVAMVASQLSGIPFSMTVHGPGIFYHPRAWGLAEKVKRSSFTACITEFCRSQCMVFADPKYWNRLFVIRCGLLDEFILSHPKPIVDSNSFVCVGRLCAEKGFLLLFEAVSCLVQQGNDLHLVVIGDGPLRKELESFVVRRNLGGNIKMLGWQSTSSVREYLNSSRGLVLPSFAEGLPIVIMEALAMARPVITSWITGIPELVEHGKNGWLIPAGSEEHLVNALKEAIDTPTDQLFEFGLHGREKVIRLHNSSSEVEKLAELFKTSRRG
jgi:colanic acid/amylovoran biosynthesis glycosyltransferase